MRTLRCFLLALAFLLPLPAMAQHAGWVAAFIWGQNALISPLSPAVGPARFHDSVRFVLAQGFDSVRFTISLSAMNSQYNMPVASWCVDDRNLACFARLMLASDAWDHPGLRRVIVTAHDFTALAVTGGDIRGYVEPSVLTPNAAAIQQEYFNFLVAMEQRFAARPEIEFVMMNWEGESIVYCGSLFNTFRPGADPTTCLNTFPAGMTNAQRVQGFLQWWDIRDAAIAQFTAVYPHRAVIGAPEFLGLDFMARDTTGGNCGGYCDPATDTIPVQLALRGGREYCSYSSYNSQGATYVERILSILGPVCRKLIIGEFGYFRPTYSDSEIMENFRRVDQARRISLPDGRAVIGVIPWRGIDCPAGSAGCPTIQRYGLFQDTGEQQIAPLMGAMRPARPTPQMHR